MHTTAPRAISEPIKQLCISLVDDSQPVFLNVTPVETGGVNDCFAIVNKRLKEDGGSVCYGWQIWEWPRVMIEAEFHAVWKDDAGILHELTPKQLPVNRVLFVPDPSRVYEGKQINNVRRPLSSEHDVADFIRASEAEHEFLNRGARAEQHGQLILKGDDAGEYAKISDRKRLAYETIVKRLGTPGRNDPCPCGSGKKYKKCHGQ
jgi:hypothetical protein